MKTLTLSTTVYYLLMGVSGFFAFYTFFRLMQLFAHHFAGGHVLLYLAPLFLISFVTWLYSLKLVREA